MARVRACAADALNDGEMLAVEGGSARLGVARANGQWFAFENNCTHEDFPLTEGLVDGQDVECALHGARFCLRTGAALAAPATCGIRVFPVAVEDGTVYVDLP